LPVLDLGVLCSVRPIFGVRSRGGDGFSRLIPMAPAVLRFSCGFPPPPFARGHAFVCMFPRALDSGSPSVGTRFLRDLGGVSAVPCLAVHGGRRC
jgi:hypothetical protein